MKKHTILRMAWLAPVAVVALVAAGVLWAHRGDREWSTDSPEALAELRRGLEADQKLYGDDAAEHFRRALELDPGFVAAKHFLVSRPGGASDAARRRELAGELRQADLSELTARERFLLEYSFARRDGESERAAGLLESYLAEHPMDPFALNIQCTVLWHGRDFDAAERCFQRLIEVDPNWVSAQNHLGYLAMAQGEWRRAEEQFAIYRYLAPDQANPHDSLAELLLLTGRWDEARRELQTALSIKPDFCHSWSRLITLDLLTGNYREAVELLERVEREARCPEDVVRLERCRIDVWSAFAGAEWRGAWEAYTAPACERFYADASVMAYHAALFAGLDAEAADLPTRIEGLVRELGMKENAEAVALHLEGIRLRHEGRPEEAAGKLREADGRLAFWASDVGYFKLATQAELWRALTAAGQHREAARVLAGMRAVNPEIADLWTAHPSGDLGAVAPGTAAPAEAPPAL